MTDIWPPEKRSQVMARIRGSNTRPELLMRAAFHRAGIRYRSQQRIGGCRVDFVLPDLRIALLVHGCFWHGCPRHCVRPSANASFWTDKLKKNRMRDASQARKIRGAGWRLVVIWEHSLASPLHADREAKRLRRSATNSINRRQRKRAMARAAASLKQGLTESTTI